jgi:hypothetical protein
LRGVQMSDRGALQLLWDGGWWWLGLHRKPVTLSSVTTSFGRSSSRPIVMSEPRSRRPVLGAACFPAGLLSAATASAVAAALLNRSSPGESPACLEGSSGRFLPLPPPNKENMLPGSLDSSPIVCITTTRSQLDKSSLHPRNDGANDSDVPTKGSVVCPGCGRLSATQCVQ